MFPQDNDIISIAGVDVARGKNAVANLHVAKLPSNTNIDIPIHIYRGKESGPVLLLMAGMHGDETNGIEILRRIIADKLISLKRGTVIIIPILNVFGFLNYSREVPDGKDVNRSFPGSTRGSLASRIAYFFMKEVFPLVDYGIDFHTGGGNRFNHPQTRCMFEIEKQFELAKVFGAPLILNSALRAKSLRREATLKGKTIIVYEAGESMRMNENAIQEGIDGTIRVAKFLGMTDQKLKESNGSIILQKSSWTRAHRSGLFSAVVKPGDYVKKNQIIGAISDPFGSTLIKVRAAVNGYVVGLSFSPVVSQGDAIVHLGCE